MNPAFLLAEPAGFVLGAIAVSRPPPLLRDRPGLTVAALATAFAVAAMTAGASATGGRALDLLLLGAVGAGVAVAGLLVGPGLILAMAVIGAVAGAGSAGLPLALGAGGIALASLLLGGEPFVNAFAAGLVAQAALRLDHPGGRGLTALVAAGMIVPLVVAALSRSSADHRRITIRATFALGAFAVVGAVVGGLAARSAYRPLQDGLAAVSSLVGPGQQTDIAATSAKLADAGRDFATARRDLEAWWVRPAAVVPVVSQHWRVLRAAAVTGDDVAAAGRRALDAPALSEITVIGGQVPLDKLAAIAGPVGDLADGLTAGRRRLAATRASWLLPPLGDRLDTELQRLGQIEGTTRSLSRALPLVPGLLGSDGPRRYFLAVQTPSELRAGGGLLGNFGEIVADNGRLSLTRFGKPEELDLVGGDQRLLLASDEYIARYGRFSPALDWSSVNVSPDFPTDAEVWGGLYPQSGGGPIDGVIAVDPAALAALLRIVGPVQVPASTAPINADNALRILLLDQYVEHDVRGERIDFLGDVAQETWRRLTSGSLPPVPQILAGVGPSVGNKHLMLWSSRPDEQSLFEDLGASGRIAPVRGDFFGLITQNAGGNKIDYFLRRSVEYQVRIEPKSGTLEATAKLTLHNDAPSSGLPLSVIGNELVPRIPVGQNKLYLSFYSPWQLIDARLDGVPIAMEDATELGRKVYSTGLVVLPKGEVTLELRLSGRLADTDTYHLDVHRQPTVVPDEVSTAVRIRGGGRISFTSGRPESDVALEVPLPRH